MIDRFITAMVIVSLSATTWQLNWGQSRASIQPWHVALLQSQENWLSQLSGQVINHHYPILDLWVKRGQITLFTEAWEHSSSIWLPSFSIYKAIIHQTNILSTDIITSKHLLQSMHATVEYTDPLDLIVRTNMVVDKVHIHQNCLKASRLRNLNNH